MSTVQNVNASDNDFQDSDGTFKYDTNSYTKYVTSRKMVRVKCNYLINDSHISKGDLLGMATIRCYYLSAKKPASDKIYYDTIVYECQMEPQTVYNGVSKTIKGMSQYALVGFNTVNSAQRQCSPKATNVTYTNSSYSSSSWGGGLTFSVGFDKNRKKSVNLTSNYGLSANVLYSHTASNTISYTANSLSLIQSNNDNGYCTWAYDYISKGDKYLDAYLYSTSFTSGMVEFPVGNVPSKITNIKSTPYKYNIVFGAGYPQSGKIIDRNVGSNRNLGTVSGIGTLSF